MISSSEAHVRLNNHWCQYCVLVSPPQWRFIGRPFLIRPANEIAIGKQVCSLPFWENTLPPIPLRGIKGIGCAGFAAIYFPLKLHFGYKIRELYYLPEALLMLES